MLLAPHEPALAGKLRQSGGRKLVARREQLCIKK